MSKSEMLQSYTFIGALNVISLLKGLLKKKVVDLWSVENVLED